MKDPEFRREVEDIDSTSTEIASTGKKGLAVFLLGILAVIILALFSKHLLPEGVKMSVAIQFMMLAVGAIIVIMTNLSPKKIVHSSVFTAGMTAMITIFSIAWMSTPSIVIISLTS
ncbi:MAG: hypothetical protein JEY82_10705 [Maridesulfovibrio ferrireducens]|nr:hypothetical protein [Maridesulfovibrio ferrireducens]